MITKKKLFSILFLLIISFVVFSCEQNTEPEDEKAIKTVLQKAAEGWNSGNLMEYMNSYWHSDSLMFVGGKTISYGWDTTLYRYQMSYPDNAAMGKLYFSHIRIIFMDSKTAVVTGKWKLVRESDIPEGRYTLIFRKLPEGWKIVYDHSS